MNGGQKNPNPKPNFSQTCSIWDSNVNLTIESSKPPESRIHTVGTVGGGHDNHMSTLFEPIHERQQLGDNTSLYFTMGLWERKGEKREKKKGKKGRGEGGGRKEEGGRRGEGGRGKGGEEGEGKKGEGKEGREEGREEGGGRREEGERKEGGEGRKEERERGEGRREEMDNKAATTLSIRVVHTLSLFGAMASSSSIKIIAGAFFSASSKAVSRDRK